MIANNKRCAWCGRSDDTVKPVTVEVVGSLGAKKQRVDVGVHPEHRSDLDMYVTRLNKYFFLFVLSNVAISILAIASLILVFLDSCYAQFIISIAMVAWGVLFIIFPFATGLTVNMVGVKKSRRFVRAAGILFILIVLTGIFL
jgi:hypothetical protein